MTKRLLNNKLKKKPYAAWRLFGILFILGLFAIRFNLWSVVNTSNSQTSIDSFNSNIESRDSSLQNSFEVYADTLYSGRALFLTSDTVSRSDWTNFVDAQNIIQRYPGVYAIAYFKVIASDQKNSLIDQLNAQRYPNEGSFSVFPTSNDSQLAVLTYIAPANADQSLIGYDIYTDQLRSAALLAARDSGLPMATKPLALKSDAPNSAASSILIGIPTYSPSQPVTNVTERRSALTGYVILSLHTKPLLNSVFNKPYDNNISVQISTNNQPIYSYGKTYKEGLKKTVYLNIGGQTWQLNYTAPSNLALGTTSKITPLLLILSGVPLIIFYLLAFYFSIRYYTLRHHHRERHGGDNDFLDIF